MLSPNSSNDVKPLQLQEEFKMEMPLEEPVIQIPVIKSVFCAGTTQTNTRLCGFVEASDLADEFRFNCFYCCEVFSLENWRNFVNHLKTKHTKLEAAFQVSEYVSEDHDYTPVYVPPSTTAFSIKNEPIYPTPSDPLGTACNPFETMILSTNSCYGTDKNKMFSNNVINLKETINNSKQPLFSQSPKTNNVTEDHIEDKEEFKSDSIHLVKQTPREISFEYTPPEIVNLLLDSMKNYAVLWQFDNEPFNEDFYEAVEDLCKTVNDKWTLNIDNLKMRRSINRILRFYCYFFSTGNHANNDKFTSYFEKCAAFLPSTVNEIAYARCFHCYICFRTGFDLKLHLYEEQKYLKWPFKCRKCKECFRQCDEYELHKMLPHYDDIFRCLPCNKTFFRYSIYNEHFLEYHSKVCNEPCTHKCDICDKTFHSRSNLNGHKLIHGERTYRCHLCPKSFLMNSRLMLHLKNHRQEYDFICEVCGKGFLRQSNLRTHMKKHTGEKVTCTICNLKLRKSSLSRHLRIAHVALEGVVETKRKHLYYRRLIRSRPLLPILKKCGEKRNYQCKICKISFENYKLVVEHNKELHSDMPKWPCKLCGAEFSQKLNLKRHYRKKHDLDVIQVYKLVDENEDLNVVLSLEKEHMDKLADTLIIAKNKQNNATISNTKSPTKPHLLSEDVFYEIERIHSSTIQDEIMKVDDNIEAQETKNDNLSDFFADLLQEHHKQI